MTSIQSKIINVNGLNIHYYTSGKGEPLIIVHGGGEGASAWKKNIALLSHSYRVYVPDLPGFGLSEPMPGSYHIPKMVDFVDGFANSLGLQKFYLMGHSFGGGIAVSYALKHPTRIRKLVLVSSLCLGKEIAWWVRWSTIPWLREILGKSAVSLFQGIKYVAKHIGNWEVIEPVTQTSMQIGSVIATVTQQTLVVLSQLPEILVPTLVMWGANDPIVPSFQAYEAAKLIPDCQVKVFKDCGHSVYRERLNEFSIVLAGFLG